MAKLCIGVTGAPGGAAAASGAESRQCDMCENYERQLVGEQSRADLARDRAAKLEHALKLVTHPHTTAPRHVCRTTSGS